MDTMTFDEKFPTFFAGVVKMLNEHQSRVNVFQEIALTEGKRYSKIVVGNSVWCFVDKTTGDVLKPASWSAPAKHARGNIADDYNGLKYLTPYGPAYLR